MKKMFTFNSKSRSRWMLLLLLLVAGVTNTLAQNVTVRGDNGSLLAARKASTSYGSLTDTFYDWGGYATWKHGQLALTMTTADSDEPAINSESGQFTNPSNNIFKSEDGKVLQLGCGISVDNYIIFSLPKGYRFRGYTIVFARDITKPNGAPSNATGGTVNGAEFGETDNSWQWINNSTETHVTGINYDTSKEYTIKRTITDENANSLYFKFTSPHGGTNESYRAFITLKSVELLFTAEADYTPVMPTTNYSGASAVNIPFSTSKVDYGRLESKAYADYAARMGYDSKNVTDLKANLTLYEAESLTDKNTVNPFDQTKGAMVKYETSGHSIYSAGNYFQLGGVKETNSDGEEVDKEQIYFIETPNYVEIPDGNKTHMNPIGYRIVGAKFEAVNDIDHTFYITFTNNNTSYYYTRSNGSFSSSQKIAWSIDDEGYISSGNTYIYANGYWADPTNRKNSATKFEIVNGQIRVKGTSNYLRYYNSGGTYYGTIGATDDYGPIASVQYNSSSEASFKVNIYDKTGERIVETLEISKSNPSDEYTLNDLNNDAVKIGVIGTGYVKGSLTMQALDPYIDRLNIVCKEAKVNTDGEYEPADRGSKVTQQFTATDFSVRGGKFNFYVPENFDFPCIFTFENLYSQYGDQTYYEGECSGNSRYNLVMSPYWTGTTNVYDTNPEHTYVDKVWTMTVGKVPFTFNNAESFEGENPTAGAYKEFPFNPAVYGDGLDNRPNNFTKFIFTQTEMQNQASKTAYLFTCDETRYNIAPTRGIQHTAYAYYEMEITMKRQDYSAVFAWKPVYTKTCYQKDGKLAEDAQWGLELATDPTNDDGTYGYLTVEQIATAIKEQAVEGATNGPTSPSQILYVDGSKLQSIVESEVTTGEGESAETTTYNMSKIKEGLGANALVFLPEGTTTDQDNFAYKTVGGGFRGANDFVLTDMNPFYTPYDINIVETKQIRYERNVTVGKNGKVTSATIIMPFDISVDDTGKHTNIGDTEPAFSLHQMQATNCMKTPEAGAESFAYFPSINVDAGIDKAEANKPYLVNVLKPGDKNNVSFVITQNGTDIKATKAPAMADDYTFKGESGNGSVKHEGATASTTYEFTHYGSYSGKKIANTENIFYFAKNMFLSSKELIYDAVKMAPFRSYYKTTVSTSGAKLASFDIFFGEGEGDVTGISSLNSNPDLMVVPGYGVITMTSTKEQNVRVHSTSGVLVNNTKLQAGETQTIQVPAGIYVINGVKIIVK